jgi:hypothetical protein
VIHLALIGSMILNEWFAAREVTSIMQIGLLLEELTTSKAEKGIQKLITNQRFHQKYYLLSFKLRRFFHIATHLLHINLNFICTLALRYCIENVKIYAEGVML